MAFTSNPQLLQRIVDVHCHPTDSPFSAEEVQACPITLCAMATRPEDQSLVRDLATNHPDNVIPCFGYHPWFSHWIAIEPAASKEEHYRRVLLHEDSDALESEFVSLLESLPEPFPLETLISTLRSNLSAFPNALLGEVGLDRSMKVPTQGTPGNRHLSPFKVPMEHQIQVLEAQVSVAVDMKRCISLHSVRCQAITVQFLDRMRSQHGDRWLDISLDLHSCGFSSETWISIEKKYPNVFLSLSTTINERSPSHRKLIACCSQDRILAESDYHEISGCAPRTMDMVKIIAEIKGWSVDSTEADNLGTIERLARNWDKFTRCNHGKGRQSSKRNSLTLRHSEEESS